MADLTDKEKAFVRAYCSDAKFNGAAAAREAGYAPASSNVTAAKLLAKTSIQDEIQKLMNKATKKALITTEGLVERLLSEAEYFGKGASHSARITALKTLTDYTGGFDKNRQGIDHSSKDGTMTNAAISVSEETLNKIIDKL